MPPSNPIASWFVPKTIGYGWTPATWEGWLVTLLATVGTVLLALVVTRHLH